MQHDEAHAGEDMALDTIDDVVGDLVVGDVAPPEEDVCRGQDLFRQAVLVVGQDGRPDRGLVTEDLSDAFGDGSVDAVRVVLGDLRL